MSDLKRRFGFGNLTGKILPRSCSPSFLRYIQHKIHFYSNLKIIPTLLQSASSKHVYVLARKRDNDSGNLTSNCEVPLSQEQPGPHFSSSKHATATVCLVLAIADSKLVESLISVSTSEEWLVLVMRINKVFRDVSIKWSMTGSFRTLPPVTCSIAQAEQLQISTTFPILSSHNTVRLCQNLNNNFNHTASDNHEPPT